jgi:hypothetical protein
MDCRCTGAQITVAQALSSHGDSRIAVAPSGHLVPQSQRDAVGKPATRLKSQLFTDEGIADSAACKSLILYGLVGAVGIEFDSLKY